MSKATMDDGLEHLMQHYDDLSVMSKELLGMARRVLVTHDALLEVTGAPFELAISRERLRELIKNENDLPVEVGSPFQIERCVKAEVLQANYGPVGVTIEVVLPEDVPMPDFTDGLSLNLKFTNIDGQDDDWHAGESDCE